MEKFEFRELNLNEDLNFDEDIVITKSNHGDKIEEERSKQLTVHHDCLQSERKIQKKNTLDVVSNDTDHVI